MEDVGKLHEEFSEIYWFLTQNSHSQFKYSEVKEAFKRAEEIAKLLPDDQDIQRKLGAVMSMRHEWVMRFSAGPAINRDPSINR